MPPRLRFNEEHDDHLVAYLAEPSQLLLDPGAVSTYSNLGPESSMYGPGGISPTLGCVGRAQLKPSGGGPQESPRNGEVREGHLVTKPQSTRKPNPQAPLPKTKFTLKKKPQTIDGVTYDVEVDITRIADDNGIHRGLAEQLFCSTGSVLEAAHLASQVRDHGLSADESADRSDRDAEEEEYGEQEELEEEFIVAKRRKPTSPSSPFQRPSPKSKRRLGRLHLRAGEQKAQEGRGGCVEQQKEDDESETETESAQDDSAV
ncbi:hypothetical protein B0H14DRAFT_2946500, partial [Mycena olivaceomarginata]